MVRSVVFNVKLCATPLETLRKFPKKKSLCFVSCCSMSDLQLETTSALPTTGNFTPIEDPQHVAQVVVNNEKQEQLYIDFASDALPVGLASSSTQITTEGTANTEVPAKRIDPRQQWINTDRTKPYYCKLCDFNMETIEVSVVLKKISLPYVNAIW